MFIDPRPVSPNRTTKMRCDNCQSEYGGKPKTADRQMQSCGMHLCPHCAHVRSGKQVGARQREKLRQSMAGDNNPAKRQKVRQAISDALKGKPFSEEHKYCLRKPKSKKDKIKEAANRPEERKRRRDRILDPDRNIYIETDKTPKAIFCRSVYEVKFLEGVSKIDKVIRIESAEKFRVQYIYQDEAHDYLPDFLIITTEEEIIVEIKAGVSRFRTNVLEKEKALKSFCEMTGKKCVTITNEEIDQWLEKFSA